MCLAQGHKAVTPVRFEPAALLSPVKHSTTEPLRSLKLDPDLVRELKEFENFLEDVTLMRSFGVSRK